MGERNSPFAAGFGSHIDVIIPHWIIQARVTWRTRFSLFVFLGLILFTHTHTEIPHASLSFSFPPFSFLVCHCLFVVIIIFFLFLGKSGAFFLFCFLNHSNRGSICYRLPFCIVSCCVKFNALACVPPFYFIIYFFQVVTIIILFLLSPFCSLACVSIE